MREPFTCRYFLIGTVNLVRVNTMPMAARFLQRNADPTQPWSSPLSVEPVVP
jgi:hypothetical protein